MAQVDGGELLARSLADAGVTVAFALHGGHLDAFFQGCRRHGIRLVDTRHEAAAGHAAEGYARSTGGLGVAVVTSGPGFANGFAALANASADRVPLLMITSSPPLGEAETNELQGGLDQAAVARPVTRWAHRVTTTSRIPDLVALAARKARAAPSGPVLLDVPVDVLFRPVDAAALAAPGSLALGEPPAPSPDATRQALALLRAAERPAIVAGGGARSSGCADALARFAERTGIPVFANSRGYGLLAADHPLNAHGSTGLAALAHLAGGAPDVVLLLGARLGLFTGGRSGMMIPPATRIVQVDLDAAEIGRLGPVGVPVVADCRQALEALLAADAEPWPDWSAWAAQAVAVHRMGEVLFGGESADVGGRLHPYHAVREVLRAVEPGSILVLDGGEAAAWAELSMHEARPSQVLGLGYLGYLGVGQGTAIGAQVAHPGRPVVQITGDGAIGFHVQEFDTMVRHGLPIVTVVVNNACWGMSVHGQDAMFGAEGEVISRLADTRYDRVAAGFGAHGERVTSPEEVGSAVERALAAGGPACIDLAVSADVVHPVTVALLGDLAATDQIVVPYYQNLPRA